MPGIVIYRRSGPATYPVKTAVTGGQLVAPDGANAGYVATAGAAVTNCLGVALADAAPRTSQEAQNPANIAQVPDFVSVAYGVEVPVTYSAATAFGALLKSAANGQVAPYVVATDNANLIVGQCSEPAGVSGAGVVARARIGSFGC